MAAVCCCLTGASVPLMIKLENIYAPLSRHDEYFRLSSLISSTTKKQQSRFVTENNLFMKLIPGFCLGKRKERRLVSHGFLTFWSVHIQREL